MGAGFLGEVLAGVGRFVPAVKVVFGERILAVE
jgi:hypothetical protein